MKIDKILLPGKFVLSFLFLTALLFAGCHQEDDVQDLQLTDPEETEHEEPEQEQPDTHTPFSVMSFNVRHHNDNDPQPLEDRKFNILKIITENTPDVVGFQEYSNDWFEDWMKTEMTTLGYGSYINKNAGKGSPKAIFYKSERFTQKAQATFQMNYTEERSGTWVILYDQVNAQDYFISNSHWTTVSSADRVKTAEKVINEITRQYKGLPLVVFGDFNAKPGTPEIELLQDSDLSLKNAHPDNLSTLHGWDAVGNSKLDYIFYSAPLKMMESEVIRTSYNGYWPSDHWPVLATFQLEEESTPQ